MRNGRTGQGINGDREESQQAVLTRALNPISLINVLTSLCIDISISISVARFPGQGMRWGLTLLLSPARPGQASGY